MDLIEVLEKQIKLLIEINEDIKETNPEQVTRNINTINDLVQTIRALQFD